MQKQNKKKNKNEKDALLEIQTQASECKHPNQQAKSNYNKDPCIMKLM
jgi:hypothetical protein